MSSSHSLFNAQLLACSVLLCSFSFAQDQPNDAGIEEILVTSEKSLSAMKAEMESAEAEVFDLFNEIYLDTEYEIICRREQVAYSRRSDRSCDTRFVRDRQAEAVDDQMFELGRGGGTDEDPQGLSGGLTTANYSAVQQHIGELDQKMRDLHRTDPDFRLRFNELRVLTEAYQNALQADREQGLWSRLFGSSD